IVRQNNNIFIIESLDGLKRKIGNFLPRLDNGDVFAVIDFADPNMLKGLGFAQKQKVLPQGSVDGSYVAYETGVIDFFSKGVVKGNNLSLINESIPGGANVNI